MSDWPLVISMIRTSNSLCRDSGTSPPSFLPFRSQPTLDRHTLVVADAREVKASGRSAQCSLAAAFAHLWTLQVPTIWGNSFLHSTSTLFFKTFLASFLAFFAFLLSAADWPTLSGSQATWLAACFSARSFFLNSRTMSLSLMLMVRRCALRGASQTLSSLVGRLRFLPFSMSLAFLFDLNWNFACQACRLLFLSRTCYSRRRHETVQKGTG